MTKNTTDRIPKIIIGMPVYNGEQFIRKAIDSLLVQTFTDYELIIADNASNDKTACICQEYLKKDARIRYFRHEKNMGALWNFSYVLNQARGEYFMWHAADDYIDSADYLSKMIAAIGQGFECAFSSIDVVSSNDKQRTLTARSVMSTFSSCHDAPSFSKAASTVATYQIYGLFRKSALNKYFSYLEASAYLRCFNDGLFVHAISEKLKLVYVPDVTFVYRRHGSNASSRQPARILVLDHMKYTMQLYRYYIFESRYQLSARFHLLVIVTIAHIKYVLRLFLSMGKQLFLPCRSKDYKI